MGFWAAPPAPHTSRSSRRVWGCWGRSGGSPSPSPTPGTGSWRMGKAPCGHTGITGDDPKISQWDNVVVTPRVVSPNPHAPRLLGDLLLMALADPCSQVPRFPSWGPRLCPGVPVPTLGSLSQRVHPKVPNPVTVSPSASPSPSQCPQPKRTHPGGPVASWHLHFGVPSQFPHPRTSPHGPRCCCPHPGVPILFSLSPSMWPFFPSFSHPFPPSHFPPFFSFTALSPLQLSRPFILHVSRPFSPHASSPSSLAFPALSPSHFPLFFLSPFPTLFSSPFPLTPSQALACGGITDGSSPQPRHGLVPLQSLLPPGWRPVRHHQLRPHPVRGLWGHR